MDTTSQLNKSLKFGLSYLPVGIVVGIYISFTAIGEGYDYFYIYSGVAAFITAFFFWWLLSGKYEKISYTRCIIIGFLTGIVSHYVCWYLIIAFTKISDLANKVCGYTTQGVTTDLIEAFKISGMLSFFSLFFVGWLTVIFGVLIAVIFNKYSILKVTP